MHLGTKFVVIFAKILMRKVIKVYGEYFLLENRTDSAKNCSGLN